MQFGLFIVEGLLIVDKKLGPYSKLWKEHFDNEAIGNILNDRFNMISSHHWNLIPIDETKDVGDFDEIPEIAFQPEINPNMGTFIIKLDNNVSGVYSGEYKKSVFKKTENYDEIKSSYLKKFMGTFRDVDMSEVQEDFDEKINEKEITKWFDDFFSMENVGLVAGKYLVGLHV